MSLFESLVGKQPSSYDIKYIPTVKGEAKRYRTSSELRDYLKKKKFVNAKYMVEDNTLFAIFTSKREKGFALNSNEYLKISDVHKHLQSQLVAFNNVLTFAVAERTEEWIILKRPLRILGNNNDTKKEPIVFSDKDIKNIKQKYHIDGVHGTVLAQTYGCSPEQIYKVAGKEFS